MRDLTLAASVVVPTFNRLGLLRQTLDCLHRQSLRECEFLIVDDGSGDETIDHIGSLSMRDDRFILLKKPADLLRGCQASKNFALPLVRGRCVVFLDSDDLLAPTALESRARFLDKQPELDMAVGEQAIIFEHTGSVMWLNQATTSGEDLDRFLLLTNPLDIPWVNGGVAIRTNSLQAAGVGYRPDFRWEDAVFHFECLCAGLNAGWMPRTGTPDCFYRIHGQSMGSDLWTEQGTANCAEMLLWMQKTLGQSGRLTQDRLATLQRCGFHLTVLRALDGGDFRFAGDLVQIQRELFGRHLCNLIRRYIALRRAFTWSRRLTWYVNRILRRLRPALFGGDSGCYGKLMCEKIPRMDLVRSIVESYAPA